MTPRLLVLGAQGMLGSAVTKAGAKVGLDVRTAGSERDVANYGDMKTLYNTWHPHYVVNCAGRIPARMGARVPVDMVRVNAYGPWVIRQAFPHAHIVHVSTDCVFSGRDPGLRTDRDLPDATDIYGRSKLMGEIPSAVVVRTSFVGPTHGLLRWFLDQPKGAAIPGWTKAYWSGGTVYDVAKALMKMLDEPDGVYHLAAPTITKYDLLCCFKDIFEKDITIVPDPDVEVYRGLLPSVDCKLERNLDVLGLRVEA